MNPHIESAYHAMPTQRQARLAPKGLLIDAMRSWATARENKIFAWVGELVDIVGEERLTEYVKQVWHWLENTSIFWWEKPEEEGESVEVAVAHAVATLWWLARKRHFPPLPTMEDCERFLSDPLHGLPMFERS